MSETQGSPQTPPAPSRRSRSRLPLGVWLGIALLPAIALVIWYVSARAANASAIRELEQAARQRGEPITLADLQAKYGPIPDEENAGIALMVLWQSEESRSWKAFANGERAQPKDVAEKFDPALPFLGTEARRMPRTGPLPSNSLAAAQSYLGAKASHLEQVRAALRRPRCRFLKKLEAVPEGPLPHLVRLKTEAQNFRIAALVAAERGDTEAAIQAIKHVGQLGQILADEPVLISQFVRLANLTLALDGVEQLLSRQRLRADELETLRLFLESLNMRGVAPKALINERPFSLRVFDPDVMARAAARDPADDDLANPERSGQAAPSEIRFMKATGLLGADRRLMMETYRKAIDLADQESPESLQKIETMFEEVYVKSLKFPPKYYSGIVMIGLQKVPAGFARFEARRRAALTALAVERSRLEHGGQIPESLGEIVPAILSTIPADPFDGKPLRFRKLERGFVVYSIGWDGEDNGGKEHTRGEVKGTDTTFIVER